MQTNNCNKPDKDCYVSQLNLQPFGLAIYFICRSRDLERNKCSYVCEYEHVFGLGNYCCKYPDRHNLTRG